MPIKQTNLVTRIFYFFCFVLFVLLVTGGTRDLAQGLFSFKLELSQLDIFGWIALVLFVLGIKQGNIFDEKTLSKAFNRNFFLAFTGLYFFVMTLTQVLRFKSFEINAYDQSYVEQAIWSTARLGNFLFSQLCRGHSYLGEHFSPILALVSPFYWIVESHYWLFIFNSLFFTAASFFVFSYAKKHKLPTHYCVLFSVAFLLYQPVRGSNLWVFREDTFFIPAWFLLIFSFENKKYGLAFSAVILSFLIKENAPLVTLLFSFFFLFSKNKNEKRWAVLTFISSIFAFLILTQKVVPYFAGGSNTMISTRFSSFGGSSSEILKNLIIHPLDSFVKILQVIFDDFKSVKAIKYLALIFIPFFIFIKNTKSKQARIYFLISFLLALLNLLFTPKTLGFHYELIFVPFLICGAINSFPFQKNKHSAIITFVLLIFACFGRSPILSLREAIPNQSHKCLSKILSNIPKASSVATQTSLHPHLTFRKDIHILSSNPTEDFVVYSFLPGLSQYATNLEAIRVLERYGYKKIIDQELVSIFCKGPTCNKDQLLENTCVAQTDRQ
ncbi:MAG: DUF2079 domain-containing protein [Bacteriovoracia bacterium]